ncbi:hypothetical protein GCM10010430_08570 [Kitasatospora cystarginea]|uniref:ABC transporter domain-containing protein n=1 Tax=Kitasatospora cystarginea TaxID=58350 RepID=A0ABN3DGQ6_9ACTN
MSIRGPWKTFGHQAAAADLDLELPVGSFIGLVGPNGAGRTTTLSMVTGLLRPDPRSTSPSSAEHPRRGPGARGPPRPAGGPASWVGGSD